MRVVLQLIRIFYAKVFGVVYVNTLKIFYVMAYRTTTYHSILWRIYRSFIIPFGEWLLSLHDHLAGVQSHLSSNSRKGKNKWWNTYYQLMEHKENCELDKAATGLRLLLKEVERTLKNMKPSGTYSFLPVLSDAYIVQTTLILEDVPSDLTIPHNQKILSLKKLSMNIYCALGEINELTQDNDKAIACYDSCAQIPSRHGWRGPSSEDLLEIQNVAYGRIDKLVGKKGSPAYDILIVNSGIKTNVMPWSLLALGTWLEKKGKRVKLMDGYCDDQDVLKEAANVSLVGFSVMTCQVGNSLRLSRNLKKLYPDKPIVWGGVHPTSFSTQCLLEDSIDFIIQGHGEDALEALLTKLDQKGSDFCNLLGVGYKNNGIPIVNPVGKSCDMENMGRWKYELIDMRKYMNYTGVLEDYKYPSVTYLSSRGCPHVCSFCINSVTKHNIMHHRKPLDVILDEIEDLIGRYNIRTISFRDECFFVNSIFLDSLVEGILERNLKFEWGGCCTIDTLLKSKESILRAKKAGLIWTGGSGESGSNRLIKMLKKRFTVEEIIESTHFLADNNLMTASCYMTLLPTETPPETKATLDLMKHIRGIFGKKNNPSYIMGPSIFRPYPGSQLYDMCVESGFKHPETLEDWGRFVSPSGHFYQDNITWLG